MLKHIILLSSKKAAALLFAACFAASMGAATRLAAFVEDVGVDTKLGYAIGGDAPMGLPNTIRHLNSYRLEPNLSVGIDATKPINDKWGILLGLRLERKGMHVDARVKNYHMEITRGGQTLAGQFTGNEVTDASNWMITIPLQASLRLSSSVKLRLGPYLSIITSRKFDGYAYDGYLRVDDPTGPKVEMGHERSTRGNYDFAEHMRRMHYGVAAGVDWYFSSHWGVYADLTWGINGIFHSNFKTVEQTLYPVYGIIGITYKLK